MFGAPTIWEGLLRDRNVFGIPHISRSCGGSQAYCQALCEFYKAESGQRHLGSRRCDARRERTARLLRSRVLVTGFAGFASAEGEATRSDLTGFIHAADGSVLALGAEARADLGPGWRAAASAAFQRSSRIVNDPLAELQLDQQLFRPAYTAEIARRIGPRTEVAVGYAVTPAFANSAIPDAAGLGPLFQRLVVPGLEYSSGPALANGVQIALLREMRRGSKLLVRGRYDRVSPDAGAAAAFRPAGDRTGMQVEVAVITTKE